MPPLEKPIYQQTVTLPPRQALFGGETDVLVVGGGPAGIAAALGAAAAGAKVILTERYGFLGGNATACLVMPMMSSYTYSPPAGNTSPMTLLPSDSGPGRQVIGGVFSMLIEELVRAGGAILPSLETGYVVPFDPEIYKSVALDLLDRANVRYLLHSLAVDCLEKPQGREIVFETKSGPVVIAANVVIDCTGDGDIAAAAGADYEVGRPADGLVQPMSLLFRMVQFNRQAFASYIREHPNQWQGVHGLWDLIKKATEAGDLDLPREDILFFGTTHEQEISVNSTRVTNVLGTNVWDLTSAEWQARRQMQQISAFFKRYVPGFEDAYTVQSGTQVCVRETRRIIGEYCLTADDVLNAKKYDDMIACGAYPIDIHNPAGKGTVLKRVAPDQSYSIPLRCLIPEKVEHLLVAGRCISGTHESFSSFRVIPISMATGQAAGVCAALAVGSNKSPRTVPASVVQQELLRQGAILDR